ncbi:MAG TPA: GreA/GreB family elongation factor [Candidatus Paceibacterota bacterium]
MYYFLRKDFDLLQQRIARVCDQIKETGAEIGRSCQEGSDSYHDNFAYEEGERQQKMHSRQLVELLRIQGVVQIIIPTAKNEKVSIGKRVRYRDVDAKEEKTIVIGSYLTFDSDSVSYNTPLARILVGGSVGELRDGKIGKKEHHFEIIEISMPSEV